MRSNPFNIDQDSNMTITLVLNHQNASTTAKKMDISTFLNPSEDLRDISDDMELDSPTLTQYSHNTTESHGRSSTSSSPTSRPSCLNSQRLAPLKHQQVQSANYSANNALPPLKFLFHGISPPSPPFAARHSTQIAAPEVQKPTRFNCRLPTIHHSRTAEGTLRTSSTSHGYQSQSLLMDDDTQARLDRRRSHHSPRSLCTSHSRISRRGSHPQSIWSVPVYRAPDSTRRCHRPMIVTEDSHMHYYRAPSPVSRKPKTTHNNKPYTIEMIDWIRYHKMDRGMAFKVDMLPLFFKQFPDRYDANATEQILSSRYYRDNMRPYLDRNGNWQVDEKGNLRLVSAKVRDRCTAEGKELDVPATLVDRAPWRVVSGRYDHWQSPILEEDKVRARRVLGGDDPNDMYGKRAEWRRIFKAVEHLMYKMEKESN